MKLPDVDELLSMRGVARHLKLHASAPTGAILPGGQRGMHRGRGLDFEEVRPYVPGDDPRSIDWRVTARRGRPHTKLFREERERPVWLLVDLQPEMFFGSRMQLKSMVAVRAAALLAWVGALGGDRVGAVLYGASGLRFLAPRPREAGVLPILGALVDMQPRVPATLSQQKLNDALRVAASLVHAGSLILAVSDFSGLDDGSSVLWTALTAHSECRWYWVIDALEQQALPNGRFRGGAPGRIWTISGASVRSRWLALWQDRASRLQTLARNLRMPLMRLATSDRVEDALQVALSTRALCR